MASTRATTRSTSGVSGRYAGNNLMHALAYCVHMLGGLVLIPKDADVPAIVLDPSDRYTLGVHTANNADAAARQAKLKGQS